MIEKSSALVSKKVFTPFILVTSLFALWGFANDITNPMVAAFGTLMELSNSKAAWVQLAFYGGYATMAIPAAMFVRRFNYKKGIILGLALYSIGDLLFYPAAKFEAFGYFLISLYILTFGLAFLETTANPYILSMGDEETATQRLNLAQAFNPIGSLLGMFVASKLILANLSTTKFRNEQFSIHPEYESMAAGEVNAKIDAALQTAKNLEPTVFAANQVADIEIIRNPYAILGIVVLFMFTIFLLKKMPDTGNRGSHINPMDSAKRLFKNRSWKGGVIAQTFYVAAQITCWTFIIQYAMENVSGMTMSKAQNYNIGAMALFLVSRFICTFLLKYFSPGKLLMQLIFPFKMN